MCNLIHTDVIVIAPTHCYPIHEHAHGHPDRTATHTHTRRQFFDCFLLQLCSSSVRLLAVGYMHASYTDAFVQHRIVSSGSGITLLVR